jgi:excisionase family DNA binding protein
VVATPTPLPERVLYDVAEAARLLHIGRSLLYELIASGQLASIRSNRRRLVPADSIAAFIAERLEESGEVQ